jgi:hypothetical protein
VVRRFRNPCGDRRPGNVVVAAGTLSEAVQPLLDIRQVRSLRCAGGGSFGGRICAARRRLSVRGVSGRCNGRYGSGRCGRGSCATARGHVAGRGRTPIAWLRNLALPPRQVLLIRIEARCGSGTCGRGSCGAARWRGHMTPIVWLHAASGILPLVARHLSRRLVVFRNPLAFLRRLLRKLL